MFNKGNKFEFIENSTIHHFSCHVYILIFIMSDEQKQSFKNSKNYSSLPPVQSNIATQVNKGSPSSSELIERTYGISDSESTSTTNVQRSKRTAKESKAKYHSSLEDIPWEIYLSRALSAWGDRIWDFALGIFMNLINPESLRLAAIQGFLLNISIILFGSVIGNWIDRNKRLFAVKTFLIVQNVAVAIACGVLAVHFFALTDRVIVDVFHITTKIV